MFGNRQHSLTLAVGESKGDGIYFATVSNIEEGNEKQIWKWEDNLLVSKWNTDYVLDGSASRYIVTRRTNSIYQKWRFAQEDGDVLILL